MKINSFKKKPAEFGQSRLIAILTETDKDDERILTVESTGALNPEEIILAGVEELGNGIAEFKNMIEQLKEE